MPRRSGGARVVTSSRRGALGTRVHSSSTSVGLTREASSTINCGNTGPCGYTRNGDPPPCPTPTLPANRATRMDDPIPYPPLEPHPVTEADLVPVEARSTRRDEVDEDPVVRSPRKLTALEPPPGASLRTTLLVCALAAVVGAALGGIGIGIVYATRNSHHR